MIWLNSSVFTDAVRQLVFVPILWWDPALQTATLISLCSFTTSHLLSSPWADHSPDTSCDFLLAYSYDLYQKSCQHCGIPPGSPPFILWSPLRISTSNCALHGSTPSYGLPSGFQLHLTKTALWTTFHRVFTTTNCIVVAESLASQPPTWSMTVLWSQLDPLPVTTY